MYDKLSLLGDIQVRRWNDHGFEHVQSESPENNDIREIIDNFTFLSLRHWNYCHNLTRIRIFLGTFVIKAN